MRPLILALLFFLLPVMTQAETQTETELPAILKEFMARVKWHAKDAPEKSASILNLDYPYMDFRDPKDYFSFTVFKKYGVERPFLFAMLLGNNVDPDRGLSLYFLKRDGKGEIQPAGSIEHLLPTERHDKFISYVLKDMRYKNEDIFRHFRDSHMLIAVFYDKDGTENKLMMSYALSTFNQAYDKLK